MTSLSIHPGLRSEGRISDGALVELTRAGDSQAFSELWARHRSAAIGVARLFTTIDPEDLVSESYTVLLSTIRRGGGPSGDGFRSYLYATVRNLARRWGSRRHEITVEDLPEVVDADDALQGQVGSLDRGLVRAAFESLPDRWREVLWYTEVEGMNAADVAPLLGLSPNAAAALSFRAREGLRQAWLQMHVTDAMREGECGWTLARIGEHSRDGLGKRAGARVDEHLAACRPCRDVALEVAQVNHQLARILLPVLLGAGPAAAWFATPAAPAAAVAAGGVQVLTAIATTVAALTVLAGVGGGSSVDPAAEAASTGGIVPVSWAPVTATTLPPPLDDPTDLVASPSELLEPIEWLPSWARSRSLGADTTLEAGLAAFDAGINTAMGPVEAVVGVEAGGLLTVQADFALAPTEPAITAGATIDLGGDQIVDLDFLPKLAS